MNYHKQKRIKELIDRLARINAADEWSEDINPTQWTALSYLAQANGFSRSPSQVAEFMTATRGTVSQTLKTLARKGLITEIRFDHDKRSISYSVTENGEKLFQKTSAIEEAVLLLNGDETSSLLTGLEKLIRKTLQQRGLRSFGVCETCKHHSMNSQGGFCELLGESLSPVEAKQICYEHAKAS